MITAIYRKCPNIKDQFSLSNNKAKLKYPVALPTAPEMFLLGSDSLRSIGTDSSYLLMSPGSFDVSWYRIGTVYYNGFQTYTNPNDFDLFVRPMISLKSNNKITSGTGSTSDPWIIQ